MNNIQQILLTSREIEQLLNERRVLVDPMDDRDTISIAEGLGIVRRVLIGVEQTGIFEPIDVHTQRVKGRILSPSGFGVAIHGLVENCAIQGGEDL